MTLILHKGARPVTREELNTIDAPPPTDTWFPIRHSVVLDDATKALTDAGFAIQKVEVGVSRNNARLFATIDTVTKLSDRQEITLAAAVVNSTDMSLPMKFLAGNRVFCCDNLSLRSDLMSAVKRKHTRNGLDRFREALLRAVTSLDQFRQSESDRIGRFMDMPLNDERAESLILRAYERHIISHRLLPCVLREWRHPEHKEYEPRTLWSLENAFTTYLADVAKSNPQRFCAQSLGLQSFLAETAGVRPETPLAPMSA